MLQIIQKAWIKLILAYNSLGNDLALLRDLLDAIVTTVQSLKIDVASLVLSHNQLTSLPEHLFEGLNNLQRLKLFDNKLAHLPEGIFEGLNNLQHTRAR